MEVIRESHELKGYQFTAKACPRENGGTQRAQRKGYMKISYDPEIDALYIRNLRMQDTQA